MNSDLHDNQSSQQAAYEDPPRQYAAPPVPRASRSGYKSPVLATLLSLMPGAGQVYVGYYPQGFLNALVVISIITLLNMDPGPLTPFLGVFLAFFWIYNLIDANRRAQHVNRVLDGHGGENLPEDFEMPGFRGSMPLGVVLVVVGTIFFLDRQFGIDMDWLENWWPVALIVGGVWLMLKARAGRD